jgi:putative peptide zinc metalloprotease protein
LVLAALLALVAGGGAAVALADGGGDTSAVAINTKDGSSVFRLAFQIRQVSGSVVDDQNAAVAYSSCTACQTVAISIQILLISSDPTVFTPINEAIAINQNCTSCDTLAAAYQFAVGIETRLKFTADGRQELAKIRHQLEALRGLSTSQIDAELPPLMSQLVSVLHNQLIGVNQPAGQGNATSAPADTSSPGPGSSTPATTNAPTPTSTSTTPPGTTGTTTSTTPTTTTTTTTPTTATP